MRLETMTIPIPDVESTMDTDYLLTIRSVRETNASTLPLLKSDGLFNFTTDLRKLDAVGDYVVDTVKECFPTKESLLEIPVHGRFQHFSPGNAQRLPDFISQLQHSGLDDAAVCKALLDLFLVSVLLDAGAGNKWCYTEPGTGLNIGRSEGIAVATFYMFTEGIFSNTPKDDPYRVDGEKLAALTSEELASGLQVTKGNPIEGFEGRLQLLNRLGNALVHNKEILSHGRPGDLLDYLVSRSTEGVVELEVLWDALMKLLTPVWPTEGRTRVNGRLLGDAWPLANKSGGIVTFHKLTQWLTYSLFKPLTDYGGLHIANAQLMTGLPEYRNGGLFVDLGVLTLKPEKQTAGMKLAQEVGNSLPTFTPDDDVIVEWRSATICLLDMLLPVANEKLGVRGTEWELTLPKLIEAGSWKSGRKIAKELRESTGGPPIELMADGTVF